MTWRPFSAAAFDEARSTGRPVLYLAAPLDIPAPELFVAVREARPDLGRRFRGYAAFVLGWDGSVVDRLPTITSLALKAAAEAYLPPQPALSNGPVWTGAVGPSVSGALDPEYPRRALAEALADTAPATPEDLELFLYAAAEWGDEEARARLSLELDRADARLLLEAADVLGRPDLRQSVDLSAAPEAPDARARHALARLRAGLSADLIGLPGERGLLDDYAWAALAFTESFLCFGRKADREAADELMRFMFQELWDKDAGGFFDRLPDPLLSPLKPAAENAVAFEALWRLRHLKGNMNYQRWLDWGLKALGPARPLARVQDMAARGRLELELVGRPGEPRTDALLTALNALYLPRKITSFVDPDDQDYILAHKLEAPSYPRLFGCLDFRPKASAGAPSEVAAVLTALRAS